MELFWGWSAGWSHPHGLGTRMSCGDPKLRSSASHTSTLPAASTRWTSEREEAPGRGTRPIPSHPTPSHPSRPACCRAAHPEEAQLRPGEPGMAQPPGLCLLALLGLGLGGSSPCWDPRGRPRRCMPDFENAAFGRAVQATNTCGSPPEDYCLHTGGQHASALCHRCDAADPRRHHNASFLTDFHSQEESTWWQSQSMAFGIQYPNSVNITLRLGKAYEITYVRLKFHTSRPESFAIYKRSRAKGPWVPFQFYSASCQKTYGKRPRQYLRPGEDEQVAFCSDEFSDISPLSGGNVAFSTLEGRPSAYNFDGSPALQEWVTVTDLLISLNRLNTFGDDIFKDPKVLQSYYYAISDFSVGGRCKCNGHASECAPDEAGQLVCVCQHHTAGTDCERCQPFYQDRPWARGTAEAAHECLPCNCSGRSEECFYDRELFRRSGHGGHCRNCRDNTAGPHCESCRQNYYRWEPQGACQPCHCHPAGSLQPQCDSSGTCVCKANVTGWKCERCKDGYHSLSEGGCRPCSCDPAGSVGTCDPTTGHCTCKERVEGHLCNRCQPGWFNLQPHNPIGCTSCFCYGHSSACRAADGYEETYILSDFSQGLEGWAATAPGTTDLPLRWAGREIITEWHGEESVDFLAPEKFLQNQRLSYGQLLSLLLGVENGTRTESGVPLLQVQLLLEGEGMEITMSSSKSQLQHGKQAVTFRLHEAEEGAEPLLTAFSFQRLLSNLTSLRLRVSGPMRGRLSLSKVQLTSARPGPGTRAGWVEECTCPMGYTGQFCQSCAPGFKREIPFGGPFISCVPCTCNQHGDCHPLTGHCQCLHNTEGPFCERCSPGFYGNPFLGHSDDCKPCPCPGRSPCTEVPSSGEVVCTHCPPGQRGKRCELCDDGFFGDPLGQRGPVHPCEPCQCHGNVDLNAVGNCDPVSGRCLRCLYNTMGDHCERCRPGFYGDALAPSPAGKCAPCDCNPSGSDPRMEGCDPGTGQCHCLPHVTGRACGQCQPGYYGLEPTVGCKSCECHPTGSRESGCHVLTGQCSCQPGVTGKKCDQCQHGFFGFSARGCRACNCSPLGSITPQCHENSTCLCHPGFVGYKCDRCQANFFLDPLSSRCQQCPACYGLVKDEAERLKARLQEMEEWLQKPGCDARPGQSAMLGDAPHGDGLPSPHLLRGAWATLLVQVGQLAGALNTARGRLTNASRATRCSDHGPPKTCTLLSEIGAVLQSAQREILHAADTLATTEIPQEIPQQPTNWSHWALEAQALSKSHKDSMAQVEAVVRRALRASNASSELLRDLLEGNAARDVQHELEAGYEEIQRAQEELGAGMAEVAVGARRAVTAVEQAHADLAERLLQVAALGQQVLPMQAGDLAQELAVLQQAAAAQEPLAQRAVEASRTLAAGLQLELQRTQSFKQLRDQAGSAHDMATMAVSRGKAVLSDAESLLASLEGMKKVLGHQKSQTALRRRMATVRDRVMVDAQRKIKQAEKTLGNSLSISTTAQRTAGEAEQISEESAKRARAVLQESKQALKHASQLATRANETQWELSRQEHMAEKLRTDLEGAQQVGSEVSEMAKSLQEARGSLMSDIETLNNLLNSLGNLEQDMEVDAVLSTGRLQLEQLWLRLATPGPLASQLSRLQQEAAQQQEKIQAFESDLAEIRADKQNLEDILRSLPESCSK
uniref:LOW QUALITY PROTEIN: laminin subunit gamma-3 n=1 Tax=Lonchura striata TaxID=40157 RepID=UPI001293E3B0|nr:LOW QUALITY PROTEIN: laminin subunit gamma-3 [Lonchura striata domestica]